jgi:putative SOS response-associated peptidase YedK
MLKPFDAGAMKRYVVSNRVNEVANDDPECVVPAADDGNEAKNE